MKTNNKLIGYIAICIYACLSGISFAWTKRLLENDIPVFTIVLIRLLIGASFLLIALKLAGKLEPMKKKDFISFLCLAMGEPVIYFIGEDFGMKYVDASFASVIIALIPVLVAFAIPMVYGGRIKKSLVAGAGISLVGIILMSFNKNGFAFDIRGLLLLLLALSAAIWYNVFLQKLLRTYGAFSITAYMNLIGAIIYLPLFFIFDFPYVGDANWGIQPIFDLLSLGVLCSACSYGLYSFAAKQLSVEKVSIFNNVAPIITIFAAVYMGMEIFTARKIIGILIVVAGVLLSQWRFRTK